MKVKTSEAKDQVLDYLVATCEGMDKYFDPEDGCAFDDEGCAYEPSCNWAQGGPIIEREGITVRRYTDALWDASMGRLDYVADGPTPLIAAMRCYVASKLGDEVEVPDEIVS